MLTRMSLETAHQMKDTGAQVILVHPSLLDTAQRAAKEAGLPPGRIFLFDEFETPSANGVTDYRNMIGTVEEARNYNWTRMSEESKERVATINYSSGTTGLPKGESSNPPRVTTREAHVLTVLALKVLKTVKLRGN